MLQPCFFRGIKGYQSLAKKIIFFYVDGIKSMTLGKTLWKIILIKLFIIFFVFKFFFFPDVFEKTFHNKEEKIAHVMQVLTSDSNKKSEIKLNNKGGSL